MDSGEKDSDLKTQMEIFPCFSLFSCFDSGLRLHALKRLNCVQICLLQATGIIKYPNQSRTSLT